MKLKHFIKKNFYLILIVILATFLRFYQVSSNPPSLSWDEAAIGWNAKTIFHTRRDEWGTRLPLAFKSFGDFKAPSYIYLTAPIVGLFGINPLSIRFLSIISGILAVIIIYLIAQELKLKSTTGLVASFLYAITPWSILMSRGAFEANLSQLFSLIFIYFLLLSQKKPGWLYPAAIFFSLPFYTYHSSKIFLPLFFLSLILVFRKKLFSKKYRSHLVSSSLLGLVFIAPFIYSIIFLAAADRFKGTSIFYSSGNMPVNFSFSLISQLMSNYLAHFKVSFLFLGQSGNFRQHLLNFGPILITQSILLVAGLIALIKKRSEIASKILIFWLLLGPIAATVGREAPHEIRAFSLLPAITLISAMGFSYLAKRNLKLTKLIGALIIINFSLFAFNFFTKYPIYSAPSWQFGYKKVAEISRQYQDQVDQVVITSHYGQPYIFNLVYQQRFPDDVFNGAMGKYLYPDIHWLTNQRLQPNKLFFLAPSEIDSNDPFIIDTIKYPDGTPAFIVAKTDAKK